jgi:hypothetical protein
LPIIRSIASANAPAPELEANLRASSRRRQAPRAMSYIGVRISVQKCNEAMTNRFEGLVMERTDAKTEAPRVGLT